MRALALIGCIGAVALASISAADRHFGRLIVGQWERQQHIRVFYGDGGFFIDPEPEGRPLGRWRLVGDRLFIRAPHQQSETIEHIFELTHSRMVVTAADGKKFVYRRVQPY